LYEACKTLYDSYKILFTLEALGRTTVQGTYSV
jgi:hypothetical protein